MRNLNLVFTILALTTTGFAAQEERGTIEKYFDDLGFLKPVPVAISGFTGEVDSVLKNDLLFMGVVNVPVEQAKYLVTGSNAGNVQGGVTDKTTKYQVMPRKGYTGGTPRSQTHALADDIA